MAIRDNSVWRSLVGKLAIFWDTAHARQITSVIDTCKNEINWIFFDRFVSIYYLVYTQYRI